MKARNMKKILITGGAGFVGSNLGILFKQDNPEIEVIAFDNLRRRGSELALQRLKQNGVQFVHGDVRNPDDLAATGEVDLILECSAEPSVHAGYDGQTSYVVQTNLMGTVNCLEVARRFNADFIFLSTSRVYPIHSLRNLPYAKEGKRFVISQGQAGHGWGENGVSTEFPLSGVRSLYGATKLASELLIEEYASMYGLRTIINRCGVLTGPWQMGKVDQGFIVLWAARHLFGGTLAYTGFDGQGLQVRDALHVADLYDLLTIQLAKIESVKGKVFNVGGGHRQSVSLAELTSQCELLSGNRLSIGNDPLTRDADIPWYVTDNGQITAETGWAPKRDFNQILEEIFAWLREYRQLVEPILSA